MVSPALRLPVRPWPFPIAMPKCGMSYVFWIKSLGWSVVRCAEVLSAPPHISQENSPKYTFLQRTTDNFFLTTSCWYGTVCLQPWRQAQHCKHSKLLPPEWLMVREWISEINLDTCKNMVNFDSYFWPTWGQSTEDGSKFRCNWLTFALLVTASMWTK